MADARPKAVALKYRADKDPAPRVVAKGNGHLAEKIVTIAKANGIPLHHDPHLAELLDALDINTQIPPELYQAVAEVLALIYRLNREVI
jgi:flagellar biosynthesis protein